MKVLKVFLLVALVGVLFLGAEAKRGGGKKGGGKLSKGMRKACRELMDEVCEFEEGLSKAELKKAKKECVEAEWDVFDAAGCIGRKGPRGPERNGTRAECKTVVRDLCDSCFDVSDLRESHDCIFDCVVDNEVALIDAGCTNLVEKVGEKIQREECHDLVDTTCVDCFELDTKSEVKECTQTCITDNADIFNDAGCEELVEKVADREACEDLVDTLCECDGLGRFGTLKCYKDCFVDNKDAFEEAGCERKGPKKGPKGPKGPKRG